MVRIQIPSVLIIFEFTLEQRKSSCINNTCIKVLNPEKIVGNTTYSSLFNLFSRHQHSKFLVRQCSIISKFCCVH